MKKSNEFFWKKIELMLPLQAQKGKGNSYKCISLYIGLWCNGNTTDSDPVIPSSNLGSPTFISSFFF